VRYARNQKADQGEPLIYSSYMSASRIWDEKNSRLEGR
jgi:hypothetical protein